MLNNQNFNQIKSELKNSKTLFHDPFFKPNHISLVGNRRWEKKTDFASRVQNVVWKRPHELVNRPVFMSNKLDLRQGRIGDCWLVSTLISICNNKDLLYKLVPQDQNFEEEYCGMFHFKFFWEYQWVDVVVDDFLPVTGSIFSEYDLIFGSTESNTFWFPLLEKAVAKLFGGYTFLHDGSMPTYAHNLLTSGLSEVITSKNDCPFNLDKLWNKLYNAFTNDTMFICTSSKDYSNVFVNASTHAVLIVDFVQFVDFDYQVRLVKLCDPACRYQEIWKGDWCLNSYSWKKSSNTEIKQLKKKLIKNILECEWWMSFNDFIYHFNRIFLNYTQLSPILYKIVEDKEYLPQEMKQRIFKSCWKYNVGYAINDDFDLESYYKMLENIPFNPQFLIDVKDESSFFFELSNIDEYGQNSYYEKSDYKHSSIKLSLHCYKLKDWLTINFADYNNTGLTNDLFDKNIFMSGWSSTVVYHKVKLDKGKYILIPNREFKNDIECRFILRVLYVGECNILPIGTPETKLVEVNYKSVAKPKSFDSFLTNKHETTKNIGSITSETTTNTKPTTSETTKTRKMTTNVFFKGNVPSTTENTEMNTSGSNRKSMYKDFLDTFKKNTSETTKPKSSFQDFIDKNKNNISEITRPKKIDGIVFGEYCK